MLSSMSKRKDPHAVALGRKGGKASMKGRTAEEREEFARQGGKAGGKARAEALTKAKRSEIARKAAAARWGKKD
jgi:general stress protein YciG